MKKRKKPKKVGFELIHELGEIGAPMYALLRELIGAYHEDLQVAKIALAWCTSWKADTDGRVTLGMCRKASDLDRQLHAYDFVILLSQGFWTSLDVTDKQRRALLDHELCHAAVKFDDETGQPAVDESGRIVFRVRKHDLEEFSDIAERYGCWKRDLESFAQALARGPQRKLELTDDRGDDEGVLDYAKRLGVDFNAALTDPENPVWQRFATKFTNCSITAGNRRLDIDGEGRITATEL